MDGATAAAAAGEHGDSRAWKVTVLLGVMAAIWAATFGPSVLRRARKLLREQRKLDQPRHQASGKVDFGLEEQLQDAVAAGSSAAGAVAALRRQQQATQRS